MPVLRDDEPAGLMRVRRRSPSTTAARLVAATLLAVTGCSGGPAASTSGPSAATVAPSRAVATPTTASPSASAPPASPTDTPAASSSLAAPSGSGDLCASTFNAVPAGSTTGTVGGSIASGKILFSIEAVQGAGTIALARIDATGLHEISVGADRSLAHAAWIPGGEIVFDSERNGGRHLFYTNSDGGAATQITSEPGKGEQDASFSPDARRFAFEQYSCQTQTDFGIHVAAIDGSSTAALTRPFPVGSTAGEQDASFSPDGTSVAFSRFVDGSHGAIFVVPAAGGDARRLTGDEFQAQSPHWSPDGKTILFWGLKPGSAEYDLWTVSASGGTPKRLTNHPPGVSALEADWSPDGSMIVFKYYVSGWDHNELHTIKADGTDEKVLWTGQMSTAETPDWGP